MTNYNYTNQNSAFIFIDLTYSSPDSSDSSEEEKSLIMSMMNYYKNYHEYVQLLFCQYTYSVVKRLMDNSFHVF